ncbi:MAG: 4Fe-4S dicluster domain-containing protein [Dehalococcoidia bacterium]|nr:4Fe-4S dicluster domain-containing protein [Dehalococcoidia bacterium]
MAEKVFNLTRDMLDPTFADLVAPDREKLLTCIQCGTCTASCPTAHAMDYTPRQLWRLIQLGLKEEVLSCNSFWLCTACYSCTSRCPRGIACTKTMFTLKRMALSTGVAKRHATAHFYEAFTETVRRHGRIHDVELMTIFFNKSKRLQAISYTRLGLTLWRKGKVSLDAAGVNIKRLDQMEAIFRKAEELERKR